LSRLEYLLAGTFLRLLGYFFALLPVRRSQVVLASARMTQLEGNLEYIERAMRARHPRLRYVHLLERYSYGLAGKVRYLLRLVRAMYYLRTSRLVIVDNAYLPIHVAPHRAQTTVVQVWHAVAALKRFGLDTAVPPAEPERIFLHRYYDNVVVSSEHTRQHVAGALRTPPERVLALGTPRTDFFFDQGAMDAAREHVLRLYPALEGRRVVLYAPTFRGRGRGRWVPPSLDAARLRAALPADHLLVLKGHPNIDPSAVDPADYDLAVDPSLEINELFTLTEVLITDYSSSIFEWALLRRPLVLLVPDLAQYERDPGLYLDYRTEMVGTQVMDTDGVSRAIVGDDFDFSPYDAFIERHLGACDGRASERFVEHFLG
jgi:teichoic acid ribitol-phosphate primase